MKEETEAANRVLETGLLSDFIAGTPEGGKEVQAFEKEWADYFGCEYAISVNSGTSALICATGALGIQLGDEVILSPWTMNAQITAIKVWGGVPIFADIEEETFNLDPTSVRERITDKTKAVIVTHIFGHPAYAHNYITKQCYIPTSIPIIEDTCQSPGARHGSLAGTWSEIGVFSFMGGYGSKNHKHLRTGEGGMCITDDPELADRIKLIRNHGDCNGLQGFNFRLTEIQAAIGREQLKKLDDIIEGRQMFASLLTEALRGGDYRLPIVKPDYTHVYYVYPILTYDRSKVVEKLKKANVSFVEGYAQLHKLPIVAPEQSCPVADRLDKDIILIFTDQDVGRVINALA